MSALKLVAVYANKKPPADPAAMTLAATAEQTDHLPFASLVISDAPDLLLANNGSPLGLYLVSERAMLNRPLQDLAPQDLPGSVGIFPMIAKPSLDPASADRYWQQVHAPLALQVHAAMTHYYQLQIVHRFFGPVWHGLALCCFASEQDLREKMYDSAEGKQRIASDIANFADTKRSPRKVVARVV